MGVKFEYSAWEGLTLSLLCQIIEPKNVTEAYNQIHAEFERQYEGHILPREESQWIFMNAGGWMGS